MVNFIAERVLFFYFFYLVLSGESAHTCIICVDWAYLCLTVEPAARGATVLLGERPDAPTLGEIAAGKRWKKNMTL